MLHDYILDFGKFGIILIKAVRAELVEAGTAPFVLRQSQSRSRDSGRTVKFAKVQLYY
jgi:hypothetical protein